MPDAQRGTADGQTLSLVNPTSAIDVSTYKSLPYDIPRDFPPVSRVVSYSNLPVVGALAADVERRRRVVQTAGIEAE